jgi:hypothetical protein
LRNGTQHIFLSYLLVILVSNSLFSQDSSSSKKGVLLSTNAEMSKLNFFHNIQINTELYDVLSIESSVGVNANKTYFQQSFAPQFSLGMGYDLLKNTKRWKLIPMIKSRTTMIDLSQNTRLNYLEGYLGYSLIYGGKWYFTHGAFFGRGVEFFKSIDSQVHFWSYSVNLGLGYEF